ncbi:MAG: PhoH family protein [Candidatus Edwardsbacteria bacterium]
MKREKEQIIERLSLAGIEAVNLLGPNDTNLKTIQRLYSAKIFARGDEVVIKGEPAEVETVVKLFLFLRGEVERGNIIDEETIGLVFRQMKERESEEKIEKSRQESLVLSSLRRLVKPKSIGQQHYLEAIRDYDIVVSIGPAGTGKTYLAVACAVASLNERRVERIILARPAVEAGESLGFLPGDFKEKIDPYMRPLYDALYDMISPEKAHRLMANEVIEIVPLAYMRGRTLNDSFIILDEAQNATAMQMKMFLTRMGFNSKAVITGDITQIDLAKSNPSGLVQIQDILLGIGGIKFVYLTEKDVVRHKLVHEIIKAYEKYEGS